MLRFRGKIPISIHPFFWLFASLIGWINSSSFSGTLIWILIILISVLVHEMGHAITAMLFGKSPEISLVALGGFTSYDVQKLGFGKQFLIVINGPIFGLLLAVLAFFILKFSIFTNQTILGVLYLSQVVNVFWAIVNLLPVMPLDGGQLLRIVLEGVFGVKGFKASLFIGMIISLAISMVFFALKGFLIGSLFFLFAFESFDMWRKSRFLTKADRDASFAKEIVEAETALSVGKTDEAKRIFIDVREKTKSGLIFDEATYFLAKLVAKEGNQKEAYDMLLPIKEQLADEPLLFLHILAFEQKNYALVSELAQTAYTADPSVDTAIRNAKACAHLHMAKPAGGWLQTAFEIEKIPLDKILLEEEFQEIIKEEEFKQFFPEHFGKK